MKVTKNIFGKVKSIEISVEEFERLTIYNEVLGHTFLNWFSKHLEIEWIFPKKSEEKK